MLSIVIQAFTQGQNVRTVQFKITGFLKGSILQTDFCTHLHYLGKGWRETELTDISGLTEGLAPL